MVETIGICKTHQLPLDRRGECELCRLSLVPSKAPPSSSPWWALIIPLLLIGAGIVWAMSAFGRETEVAPQRGVQAAPPRPAAAAPPTPTTPEPEPEIAPPPTELPTPGETPPIDDLPVPIAPPQP
ncbi:MAG: hypothetical protein KJO40_11005 [Deltaproteobacteria bacterium]|nr:hypothetical protein [Deltaproteobacteria bacterium]NND30925.1 hypothetical protein [Myxococcales bacterium]MBT8464863.1 hypothetical protein [Deltaproteobacteria bacterium]MBT8480375.1 hypothetical protein [Deltaproteobacteria bacterium]NNK07610.1 hypothetical protein [Myxococcales bacterium]